jgi:hypothetical protein
MVSFRIKTEGSMSMKKFLLASAAAMSFAGVSCATTADDNHSVHISGDGDHHSIHVSSEGGDSTITVNGQTIEVRDGAVFIDGERHEMDEGNVVVVDGTNIHINDHGGRHFSWSSDSDGNFAMGDVEGEVARALAMVERLDFEALAETQGATREALEAALADLDVEWDELEGERVVIVNGERREMTDEEREEIREALAEARIDIREAMRDVHIEMREVRDAARGQRVEVRRIRRDAERHARDAERHAGRHAERAERLRERIHAEGANSVRFESENGEQRVWVDDRELEGEERTEWLNRMELGRLDGGEDDEAHAYFFSDDDQSGQNVFVIEGDDGETRELTFRSGSRIVIDIDEDDADGEARVYEFEFGDESDTDE